MCTRRRAPANPRTRTLLAMVALLPLACLAADALQAERAGMLGAVEQMAEDAAGHTGHPRLSAAVMKALGEVPRHEFVPPSLRGLSYLNRPLPIGEGQTISQPYIVALMTHLLNVGPGARVLEVGTGSGYQAAVLAQMGVKVWSIEIIDALARSAVARLRRLGYGDVEVRAGDGYVGWPEAAPFDGILVTAAAPHVPQPLVDQLRAGAVMVIPVGPDGGDQRLLVIEKRVDGGIRTQEVLPVRFVPLTGSHPAGRTR